MTNKTIETRIENLMETYWDRTETSWDDLVEFVEQIKEALREQAAQTMPSWDDLLKWATQEFGSGTMIDLHKDLFRSYNWLRDNSKPKERPEATFAHIQKLAFEFAKEHHYGDQYTMFSFTMGYQRALEGLRVFIRDIEKQEMPDTWKLHRIFGYAETIEANTERHEVSDEEIEKEYDNYRSNNYSNSRMEVWVAGYRAALERMKESAL